LWRAIGAVFLVLCGASGIPFGAWVIAKSRLPSWMKGIWKWPLGNNISSEVANLQGWASALVGAGSLVLLIPLLLLPRRDAVSRVGVAVAVLFVLVGVIAYVRSVVLSHQSSAEPPGTRPALTMPSQNQLALGLVAGIAAGALLAASVIDAFPGPSDSSGADVTSQADGLHWTDVKVGSGASVAPGKLLSVRYTLWLGDGTRIDSTEDRGQPFTFTLGKGEVIKGLDEGVIGMRVGGIRWLTVPPDLAYGAGGEINPSGPSIPPNSTLVFVIQLLSVSS
jgi:hypothetical protein